jgi:hypothetical protein
MGGVLWSSEGILRLKGETFQYSACLLASAGITRMKTWSVL